jgi:hypothetical protein
VDALGPKADEGRGKAALSLDEPSNGHSRGYPNGETLSGVESDNPFCIGRKVSGGTETSKYPEEKKSTEIPLVVANERGSA